MPFRFDINYDDPGIAWEPLVDEVFGELSSSFLEMPKGEGFIDYPTFEKGYQALKRRTDSFAALTPQKVLAAIREVPIAFIVFRCILGFSPPEWGLHHDRNDQRGRRPGCGAIDRPQFPHEPAPPRERGSRRYSHTHQRDDRCGRAYDSAGSWNHRARHSPPARQSRHRRGTG